MTTTSKAQHMEKSSAEDIHAYLTRLIKQATQTYLTREQISFDVEQLPVDLRFSAQSSFGDYSMPVIDRKSTRLNSSHTVISYAVFCLKKKKNSSPCTHRRYV